VDSLDYRDMDGNPFYEPALELGFAGTVTGGGFSAACVATSESDRGRWHIVTGDAAAGLAIYSIGSTSSLPFDVGDHLYAQADPNDAQRIARRQLDLASDDNYIPPISGRSRLVRGLWSPRGGGQDPCAQ